MRLGTNSSEKCQRELIQLYNSVIDHDDQEWGHCFTDGEINSYLAEHFVQSRLDKQLLPEGVSQPRIVIEPDKVRVAFRYGSGLWSTVVSIDLRLWLVKGEPNVVALKLVGFHAALCPSRHSRCSRASPRLVRTTASPSIGIAMRAIPWLCSASRPNSRTLRWSWNSSSSIKARFTSRATPRTRRRCAFLANPLLGFKFQAE